MTIQAVSLEDLKAKLNDPNNEGCCIKYTVGQRDSFLARVNNQIFRVDRILHVDKLGRAAPPDIKNLIAEMINENPQIKFIDLTGAMQFEVAKSRGWNYGDCQPPENPEGQINATVQKIKAGTWVGVSSAGHTTFGQPGGTKEPASHNAEPAKSGPSTPK